MKIAFEDYDLGLKRDGFVELHPHSALWAQAYQVEQARLTKAIPALSCLHIGSTAVPDIHAKPILDILGLVNNLEHADKAQHSLEQLGYQYKGEYGLENRRYCVLYNTEETIGFVHLHIYEQNAKAAKEHIKFRDYLRTDRKSALQYEFLKFKILEEVDGKRSAYTEAKSDFIRTILSQS